MKKVILFAAVVAAMMTGCAKDDNAPANNDANAINFRITGSKGEARATSTVNGLNFNNFLVWSFNNNSGYTAVMTRQYVETTDFTNWTYAPTKYWPAVGTVDFYAYSPAASVNAAFAGGGAAPVINYELPIFKLNEDLLAASEVGATSAGGTVDLAFNHILSQFLFQVRGTVAGLTYTVEKIEFVNVDTEGSFNFTTWTLGGTLATVTALDGAPVAVAEAATFTNVTSDAANTSIFLIPGSWTEPADDATIIKTAKASLGTTESFIAFTYSIKDADGVELNTGCADLKTVYIPMKGMQAGEELNRRYTYQIELGSALVPIEFTATATAITPASVPDPSAPYNF